MRLSLNNAKEYLETPPVKYHTLDDLQFGRETGNLLHKFIRRAPRKEEVRMGLAATSDMTTLTGMQAYQMTQSDG